MKITKARLLQIIREEVELHEKNIEENTVELDESSLEELSKEQGNKAISDEIELDKESGKIKESDVEEDQLLSKEKPHKVINPKHRKKLEIKIK